MKHELETIQAELDRARLVEWFIIMTPSADGGPPRQVGFPVFGQKAAQQALDKLTATGGTYAMFGVVGGA